jgi:hypothetical protein
MKTTASSKKPRPTSDEESDDDDELPGAYSYSRRAMSRDVAGDWDPTEPAPASRLQVVGEDFADESGRSASSTTSMLIDIPLRNVTIQAEVELKKQGLSKLTYLLLGGVALVCLVVGITVAVCGEYPNCTCCEFPTEN